LSQLRATQQRAALVSLHTRAVARLICCILAIGIISLVYFIMTLSGQSLRSAQVVYPLGANFDKFDDTTNTSGAPSVSSANNMERRI